MSTEIPREKTPIALSAAAPVFVEALKRFDGAATYAEACYLLGLAWNETGAGKLMQNFNWGNISGEFNGNFFRPPWYVLTETSSTRMKELHALMVQGKVPSKFRAYSSHAEGLEDFLRQLFRTFPTITRAAILGDSYAFADAIYSSKYCPDDGCRPEKMSASYAALARQMGREPAIAVLPKAKPGTSAQGPTAGSSSASQPSASSVSGSWYAGLGGGDDLPVLRRGSKGPAVALWQALIGVQLVDGDFGSHTEADTIAYQRAHSYAGSPLVDDGIVGDMTWLSVIEILRRQQTIG